MYFCVVLSAVRIILLITKTAIIKDLCSYKEYIDDRVKNIMV